MSSSLTGAVVYEGPSMLDGRPIVAILTFSSANVKTGGMAQLWIISALCAPLAAIRHGLDASVCGACPHRGGFAGRGRTCYVDVGKALTSVYRAWQAGRYLAGPRALEAAEYALAGRTVRLGAYGDPAAVPEPILRRLAGAADGHTGYTHQWRRFPTLATILMASTDTAAELEAAQAAGWRCFHVLPAAAADKPAGTAWCQSAKRQCVDCLLCDGARKPTDKRRSIAIRAHGANAKAFRAD